ncbi:hypothetical protein C8Q80DRAFT_1115236, partial [Daedaleopsis nitida]
QPGLWKPASCCNVDEDVLADLSSRPYTPEVDHALRLHLETFKTLLTWEPGQELLLEVDEVPVLGYVQVNRYHHIQSHRAGVVPFVGNLDIDSCAQIHNWIDVNVPGARENRHLWISRYTVAHAITLLLANRMCPDPPQPPVDEKALLQRACESDPEVELHAVNVDGECMRILEQHMFEVSAAAREAGFFQWGLDAGDHQDG